MSADFSYGMHVENIRRALWRPRSKAAVMVGSGFSRNADALTSAAPPFPLWGDVVSRLQKDLASSTSDPLRLGEEYQHAASRTAFDDLLLEMIPDGKYQPGRLHEMLLSLPWSDVFTTNYDTLLERTKPGAHHLVLTPADIARSERPRIIKLHGSFPSHRPFIFTAEDYRRYPRDFAPFVNMVQQSIMENFFCMIGFSGNDPNFLQWIGWVRDQLGPAAPKIYLCDVLDLTPAKERLYQSMHVIPIDLGPIVPKSKWTNELRRPKALEWFLGSLHQGRRVDISGWPRRPSIAHSRYPIDKQLPPLMDPPEVPRWVLSPAQPVLDKVDRDGLKRLAESWREEREGYPGWVVAPETNREILLSHTDQWLGEPAGAEVMKVLDAAPAVEKAGFLYELAWRIRQSLVPLPDWLYTAVIALLERLNPKPELIELKGLPSEPETPSGDTDGLTVIWVELAFMVLNHAWEDQRDDDFKLWLKRLERIVRLKPDWLARWHFEQCWYHLLRLDEPGLRAALKSWSAHLGLPFWEAKRAVFHAELGHVEDALSIAETALERVRQGTRTGIIDYGSLSQEGWIIGLIRILELERSDSRDLEREELLARLRELQQYQCDPYEDGARRERHLLQHEPKARTSKQRGFDPGVISIKTQFQSWGAGEWVLLQTFHDGAWPLRCGSVTIYSKGLAGGIPRLWRQSPRVAIAIGLLAQQDAVRTVLGRVDVAALDPAVARSLYAWLSTTLNWAMEAPANEGRTGEAAPGLNERVLEGCPEILSRLTLHLSPEQLDSAFDLAVKLYSYEPFRKHSWRHSDRISAMFRRVLFAASPEQIFKWLPRLLGLPIVGAEGFVLDERLPWPEPTGYVPWDRTWRPPTPEEKTSWSDAVGHLTRFVQNGPPEVRKRASIRLALVSLWGGLTESQSRSFVGALWSQTDNLGFPTHAGFQPWVLLALHERQPGDSRRAVSRLLLEQPVGDLTDHLDSVHQATAHDWHTSEERKRRIEWTSAEAETLLRRILAQWEKSKPVSHAGEGRRLGEGGQRLVRRISRALGDDVLPNLAQEAQESLEAARGLLNECERLGGRTLVALPALLMFDSSQSHAEEAARRILLTLHGSRGDDVEEALGAFSRWVALARRKRVPPAPPRLLNAWVGLIVSRRQPGLSVALGHLIPFVDSFGDELAEHHLEELCDALSYLAKETKPSPQLEAIDDLPLEPEERIELRGHAARLAASLAMLFHQKGKAVPPALEAWRNIGTMDTLPEVRRAWIKIPAAPMP